MSRRISLSLMALPLALVLAFTSPARAQADDGSTVEVAILDVLLARGLIDQAQYDELLGMARERIETDAAEIDLIEGRLARLRAPDVQVEGGGPGKLVFKSADGKWSTELKGWMQARVANRNSSADGRDGINFSVPRARLILAGNAGRENIRYKLEIDASTNSTQDSDIDAGGEPSEQKDSRLKDAYIDYGVTETGLIRFGHYKFPFSREELVSDSAGSLVEKSLASTTFAPKREPGISWQGKAGGGAFEYQVAASNGDGENEPNMVESTATGTAIDTGDGLRYGVRAVWYPLGEMKYDLPSFQTLDGGSRLAVGLAYMVNKDARFTNTVIAGTGGDEAETIGAELQYMCGPFSGLVEWFDRGTDLDAGGDLDDDGYTLQAGWFLEPRVWELVARLSQIDQTDAALAEVEERVIGINRYIDGHNGKWMLDLVDLNNDTTSGLNEEQIRLQYQLMF